ncbi:hypothetical protein C2S53_000838 [Perilla frutescens var. hirtella]|uniref:Uncharacterized protein n=1 Tax=Perilla frutescens var. hirtella TaxID=608512 RepID=A0AAD4IPK4_PERFH|nr:hypothetical protein C2S53_000838 [Perilla frutescens var. hirtella]
MAAILRKDFMCLFLRNSSFLCKSRVSFSTFAEKKSVINPTVFDFLIHKHHFSPEAAAEVSSALTPLRNPEKSDSLLSFLKENGFSNSHLERLLKYRASFISADLEQSVKPKIKIFQELGFSNNEIASLFASNPSIFYRSANNRVIPALSRLRNLLGSDANVVKLVKKSGWFVIKDLDKQMLPNIEFLKSRNVDMEQIIRCMHSFTRFLLQKPENVRKQAEKAEELGAQSSSKMYIHAVRVIGSMSDEAWERKLQTLRGLGFSEDEILKAFRKCPPIFCVSVKKMKEVNEILVSTGKYDTASIVSYPLTLCCSVEKRHKPRLQVLAALDRKKLIKKWPSLGTVSTVSDEYFFRRFVGPYMDEVGHLFVVKSTTSGKSKAKLSPLT